MDSIRPVELDPGQSPSFGELLRRHRIAAGLTQEALADRAGLSANAVSTLERGARHAPHKETIALLATALRLSDDERAALGVAAQRRPRPVPNAARPLPGRRETPCPPYDPLPAEVVPLLEREREEAEVGALLRHPDVRLLTLTGPGGVGKTSLALRAAHAARADFADGAAFVALAEVVAPDHVAAAIALALALRDLGGRPLPEALRDHLRDKQLLLVLDNFEHVADAAPLVAALRQDCPRLMLLVTSRHALRLRGEYCFDVLPLATPRAADASDLATLARYAAVRLFLHYARAAVPDFALTAANAAAVADVCARLDGLPLAIELAAARLPVLSPADLSARLARRLDLLADGPLDAPRRHRTMRASIAWSYELLAPAEQTVFLCLCVCVGGGTLAAVEAIAAALDDQGTGVAEVDVLAALGALARKSLLRREGRDADAPRFAVLQVVREYGLERAAASGALAPLRRGHAAYVLALAETAAAALRGPGQAAALAHLEAEADNLRAALSWALEDGDTAAALRLVATLWPAWYARGYLSEGRAWLERVLAAAEASGGDVALLPRARVLDGAGLLAYSQGDDAIATARCDRALALYREAGDTEGMAAVLNNLGHVARATGDHPRARSLYEHSLELRRDLRDARGMAASLNNLALVAGERGRYTRAEALYHESLALKRELGDTEGMAVTLNNLGLAARAQGQTGRARALHEESLRLFRAAESGRGVPFALANLAVVAHDEGDDARAEALAEESLALRRAGGDRWGAAYTLRVLADIARDRGEHARAEGLYRESLALLGQATDALSVAACLEGLAVAAWESGELERAAEIHGVAAALRAAADTPLPPPDGARYEPVIAAIRAALGDHRFDAVRARGQALSLEQAVARAREGWSAMSRPIASRRAVARVRQGSTA